MNEKQWLACTDPIAMIEFLRGSPTTEDSVTWWNSRWRIDEESRTGSNRTFRQFACACCRRIWDHIPEACNRDAVTAVEDYLDGHISAEELEAAIRASSAAEWNEDGSGKRPEPGYWAVKCLGRGFYKMTAAASALWAAAQVLFMADEEYGRDARPVFHGCYYTAAGVFLSPFEWPLPMPATVEAERAAQTALIHCIFGNPFRPVAFDPTWRSDTAVPLARQMYESRDFSLMPILGDALQEAGCENEDMLTHCRSDGAHVRGCWVVDLVLAKE